MSRQGEAASGSTGGSLLVDRQGRLLVGQQGEAASGSTGGRLLVDQQGRGC